MKHGDRHRATMELADFWLLEKQLIHKLFKVIVPRYVDYTSSFTRLLKLAPKYKDNYTHTWNRRVAWMARYERGVLELKGNPYPSLIPPVSKNQNFITNVLLDAAREKFERRQNPQAIQE